ncbi:MAG: SDR family NAD(P)-dependent oxidoreductase [Candidatus Rokuibacteriota bacterium]
MTSTQKVAIVTGAGSGIGKASALALMKEGYAVAFAGRRKDRLEAAAAEGKGTPGKSLVVPTDVSNPEAIKALFAKTKETFGRLDVLFNNAGVIRVQPMFDVTEAEWDRVMDVNLRAVFFVLQAVAKRMLTQDLIAGSELRGKLIQTASIASYRGGNHLMTPYSASKAGVVSLTRSAAQALAPERITSNCVCPGAVETPMWEQIDKEWGALEGLGQGEAWKRRIRHIPLGRPERAEDVASVVAFLAGPDSDYMTGQAINVDGGIVMGS